MGNTTFLGAFSRRLICTKFLRTGFGTRQEIDIVNEIEQYLDDSKENYYKPSPKRTKQIRNFVSKWAIKWRASHYKWDKFLEREVSWLNGTIVVDIEQEEQGDDNAGPSKRKCFSELSQSQKIDPLKVIYILYKICTCMLYSDRGRRGSRR